MKNFNAPRELQGNPEIRIIGSPNSGKTAFMAALARWPNADRNSPIKSVQPNDDETAPLITLAQDILENGLPLTSTDYINNPNERPLHTLLIEMKPAWFKHPIDTVTGRTIRFRVSCKEYAGEFIEDLLSDRTDERLSNYLQECASVLGLLILIDGTSTDDALYAQALENLQKKIAVKLQENRRNLQEYRIAIVFSKSEIAPIWSYRYDLQKFINLKFYKTQQAVQNWCKAWKCSTEYFFCSAFGTKGNPPTPNVKGKGRAAVIAHPQLWRPIGLVAPIYWLHTGKDDPRLRKME